MFQPRNIFGILSPKIKIFKETLERYVIRVKEEVASIRISRKNVTYKDGCSQNYSIPLHSIFHDCHECTETKRHTVSIYLLKKTPRSKANAQQTTVFRKDWSLFRPKKLNSPMKLQFCNAIFFRSDRLQFCLSTKEIIIRDKKRKATK